MIESTPLVEAPNGYARMMSGVARFRMRRTGRSVIRTFASGGARLDNEALTRLELGILLPNCRP